MNNRDKLQKFSIRKYAIGTFSTVIATLVFVGFNPDKHTNEVSQNQKVIEQQEDSQIDEDNSNSKAHQYIAKLTIIKVVPAKTINQTHLIKRH